MSLSPAGPRDARSHSRAVRAQRPAQFCDAARAFGQPGRMRQETLQQFERTSSSFALSRERIARSYNQNMSSVGPQRTNRALAAYAAAVLGFMILVILWGAVVRATGSGAGCGDRWPLCNGDFFPHHPRIATMIEFTHRSMSGICTVLVGALIAWTFVARPRGDRARTAAV